MEQQNEEQQKEFSSLEVETVHLAQGASNSYTVYKDEHEFVTIEAKTAFEAMEKSGIKEPYKIIHQSSNKFLVEEKEMAGEATSTDKPATNNS